MPQAKVEENLATVPGTDGAKMSKSYKNTIDIFSDAKTLKKQISSIVTDSTALEEPKEWRDCNVYKIAELFLNEDEKLALQKRYEKGGEGYGHFKMYLNEVIWDYFKDAREKFDYFMNHKDEVFEILDDGAKKAKAVAEKNMQKIRKICGIYR